MIYQKQFQQNYIECAIFIHQGWDQRAAERTFLKVAGLVPV